MSTKITFAHLIESLRANAQNYGLVELQNGAKLVVTQRGGRVLGPFLADDAEGLFWMNAALGSPDAFAAFLEAGDWNLGGERVWIAPEIQFTIRDRADFWGSYHLPEQMDPGSYTLDQPSGCALRLRQQMTLTAYNTASGHKTLTVSICIHLVKDPLRHLNAYDALMDGVTYAGYEQTITLTEAMQDNIMAESWNLVQLNPGGIVIVPASPHLETTTYLGTPPQDAIVSKAGALRIPITGDHQFKTGYKAAHVTGRMGYYHARDASSAYLLVRSFYNNPSSIYLEEPPDWPGKVGDSIHIYNDDGGMGGFGEMECHGQTIGGVTDKAESRDPFTLWCYAGPPGQIKTIAAHLLGVVV